MSIKGKKKIQNIKIEALPWLPWGKINLPCLPPRFKFKILLASILYPLPKTWVFMDLMLARLMGSELLAKLRVFPQQNNHITAHCSIHISKKSVTDWLWTFTFDVVNLSSRPTANYLILQCGCKESQEGTKAAITSKSANCRFSCFPQSSHTTFCSCIKKLIYSLWVLNPNWPHHKQMLKR